MSPDKIVMEVVNYTENKEPLYVVTIYTKEDKVMQRSPELTKKAALHAVNTYCSMEF